MERLKNILWKQENVQLCGHNKRAFAPARAKTRQTTINQFQFQSSLIEYLAQPMHFPLIFPSLSLLILFFPSSLPIAQDERQSEGLFAFQPFSPRRPLCGAQFLHYGRQGRLSRHLLTFSFSSFHSSNKQQYSGFSFGTFYYIVVAFLHCESNFTDKYQ